MTEKLFTFYWRDGTRQVLPGGSAHVALTDAGYGNGAIGALDFHAHGDDHKYVWNAKTREWDMTPEYRKKLLGEHL